MFKKEKCLKLHEHEPKYASVYTDSLINTCVSKGVCLWPTVCDAVYFWCQHLCAFLDVLIAFHVHVHSSV